MEIITSTTGDGSLTAIFVHGFGCDSSDWQHQIKALSPFFRCITLDLPGHGGSGQVFPPTIAGMARAVNQLKDGLPGSMCVLIGHSLGAKIVREAYCQSPERVQGVVLLDGRYYEGDTAVLVEQAKAEIETQGFRNFASRHFLALLSDSLDPVMREKALRRVDALDPDYAAKLYLDAVAWDKARGRDTLEDLIVPLLVVQSTYVDSTSTRRSITHGITTPLIETALRFSPKSEVRYIDKAGHFPMLDQPKAVSDALLTFMEDLVQEMV
jgi:Predicted hydrolases or acyltransferases (alpha/beta hydrolase superfamily)